MSGTESPPDARHPFRPKDAKPYPGNMLVCPQCGHRRLDFMAWDYAACERRGCGYEWHGEPTPAYREGDRCEGCGHWYWQSDEAWHSLVPITYADTLSLAHPVLCPLCDPEDEA